MHIVLADQSDFVPIERNITITSDSITNDRICFEVTINGDNLNEANEMFTVEISVNAPDMVQEGQNLATITIIHDGDCKCIPLNSKIDSHIE